MFLIKLERRSQAEGEVAGGIGEFFEFYLRSEVENSARCQTTGSIGATARGGRCRERRRRENDRGAVRSLMEL